MDVRFEHVSLTYNRGNEVLHDIDFKLPDGELIALLGPSGGGKSTILNLISGLLQATSGKIYFGEDEVTKKTALQRGVGMVFQNYALHPHMSVIDNIAFPMKMAKVDKKKRLAKARELATLVRVDDQLDKFPSGLSGGQQQRVAIARALAKNPSVLLLDEPLSNLDARLRVEMREEIRRIQQETGVTTVFVTHDQSEAMHVADHIMLLNDGFIQQFSTPQSLYETPANRFVSRFIGDPVINEIAVSELENVFAFPDTAASIGIRAEALVAANRQKPQIKVMVKETQLFGREYQVRLLLNGHELIATNDVQLTPGQIGMVSLDMSGVHIFNEQGERLNKEVQTL